MVTLIGYIIQREKNDWIHQKTGLAGTEQHEGETSQNSVISHHPGSWVVFVSIKDPFTSPLTPSSAVDKFP